MRQMEAKLPTNAAPNQKNTAFIWGLQEKKYQVRYNSVNSLNIVHITSQTITIPSQQKCETLEL